MRLEKLLARIDNHQAELQGQRPLSRAQLLSLRQYYKIGLTYASNRLEGNSLTLQETKIVIEDGLTAHGKPLRDHLEAQGHAAAYDHMIELARQPRITERAIKDLHRLFYQGLDAAEAGRYRQVQVYLSGSEFIPPKPSAVPALMKQLARRIPGQRKNLHPVLFAAWLHFDFVTIHPFVDGNGRAARLLMNLALLQASYPIAIIPPLRRDEYIRTLEAGQMGRGMEGFNLLIAECVWESLRDYQRLLQA